MSLSWISMRSVSMSASRFKTNVASYTFVNNQYIIINVESYTVSYFPYIIHYLSPYYSPIIIPLDLTIKNRITKEQLIGVVCGSTAVFFFVLGIIIFVIRRKTQIIYDFDDYPDNSSDFSENEAVILQNNEKNDLVKIE